MYLQLTINIDFPYVNLASLLYIQFVLYHFDNIIVKRVHNLGICLMPIIIKFLIQKPCGINNLKDSQIWQYF